METLDISTAKKTIKLVDGDFTPTHTSDLLKSFLNTKINYHKLHRLILQEKDHSDTTPVDNARIQELQQAKVEVVALVEEARSQGKNIQIKSIVTLEFTDQ